MLQGIHETMAKDGHKFSSYCAVPKTTVKGGLVVVQEVFGVTSHIKDICDKFAEKGYISVALALFDRISPNIELSYDSQEMEKGVELMRKLKWDGIFNDVEAAYKLINDTVGGRVGAVGYCFGGTVVWRAAAQLN